MILNNAEYSISLKLEEDFVNVLVIENKAAFRKIVQDLCEQCEGSDGGFIISQSNKIMRMDKVADIIFDPIRLNFNNRKIQNALFKELSEIGNDFIEEKQFINSNIVNAIDQITSKARYDNIEFNLEYQWIDLFKVYDVKIAPCTENLLENILEYIKVVRNLCGIQILYMVNMNSYFDRREIACLYEIVRYNKMHLIMIEPCEAERNKFEKICVVDQDMCVIQVQ